MNFWTFFLAIGFLAFFAALVFGVSADTSMAPEIFVLWIFLTFALLVIHAMAMIETEEKGKYIVPLRVKIGIFAIDFFGLIFIYYIIRAINRLL